MKKILIITGLTCSGKSSLGVKIAKQFNGEVISADSVQVYRGLNIGSAKVDKNTLNTTPHHLIDIKNPNETYNVGEFVADCKTAIEQILKNGKNPIIIGGTGLYIKALLEGFALGNTTAHEDFRQKMQIMAQKKGNMFVWQQLNQINPEKAKNVHFNNLKRVIRYLEIEKFGNNQKSNSILKDFDVKAIALIDDRQSIYNKINLRVDDMINSGLENEVKSLINQGVGWECQSMQAIGYKEWQDYFNNKADKLTTINLIKQHTRNYCKRQLTFFKTIKNLYICNLAEAEAIIKEFYDNN